MLDSIRSCGFDNKLRCIINFNYDAVQMGKFKKELLFYLYAFIVEPKLSLIVKNVEDTLEEGVVVFLVELAI